MSAVTPPPDRDGAGGPDEPGARGMPGVPVPVPHEMAVAPPGAVLAGMLEDVEIETVSGHDTVTVMLAEYRLMCRQQARFYRAVLETGLRKPFSISTVQRVTVPGEFAAEEARAALVWSRARAERVFGFAVDLFCRLPVLGEAMLAGRLDEFRARALVDWTSGLTDAQAETVCAQLLPEAAALTVGELIDRIKRACLAIDPDWAEKRYREAVRTRRVHGSRNPDGTANLGGYSQPIDRIAAAAERIDTLARACKRAGDRRTIDLIRSDLFLGLNDGTFEGMTEVEIVAYVLAHPYAEPDNNTDNNRDGGRGDGGRGDGDSDGDGDGEPGDTTGGPGGQPPGDGPGYGGSAPDDSSPARPTDDGPGYRAPGDSTADEPTGGEPSNDGEATSDEVTANRRPAPDVPADEPVAGGSAETGSSGAAASAAGRSATRWAAPEVRVELATLLGINEHPAEIPPWGYVPAALARQLVADMHAAQWRYVFCDPAGRASHGGLIHTRPATTSGAPTRRDPRRGGIIEIAVAAGELARIAATQPTTSRWKPVLVELARAAETRGTDSTYGPADQRPATATNPATANRRSCHPCPQGLRGRNPRPTQNQPSSSTPTKTSRSRPVESARARGWEAGSAVAEVLEDEVRCRRRSRPQRIPRWPYTRSPPVKGHCGWP